MKMPAYRNFSVFGLRNKKKNVYLCIHNTILSVTVKTNAAMTATRNITDMYMLVLASLSNNDKLDLIAKLSSSMRDDAAQKRIRPNLRTCFKGDWSGIDAESLRNRDYNGRTVEAW